MVAGERGAGVRLAEIVAMLSLVTDLGYGQPMEHCAALVHARAQTR
jgi:hypothetical protein